MASTDQKAKITIELESTKASEGLKKLNTELKTTDKTVKDTDKATTSLNQSQARQTTSSTRLAAVLRRMGAAFRGNNASKIVSIGLFTRMRTQIRSTTAAMLGLVTATVSLRGGFLALAGIGGIAGIGAPILFFSTLSRQIDATSKSARQLGIDLGTLTAVQLGGGEAGVSRQAAATGLDRLNRNIGMMQAGRGGDFEATLKQYNITARDTEGILKKVSDLLAKTGDESERAGIAARFFGNNAGPELAKFLQQGSGAIDKYTQEVKFLGLAISEEFGQRVEFLNDQAARVLNAIRGVGFAILNDIAVPVGNFLRMLSDGIAKNRDLIVRTLRETRAFFQNVAGLGLTFVKAIFGDETARAEAMMMLKATFDVAVAFVDVVLQDISLRIENFLRRVAADVLDTISFTFSEVGGAIESVVDSTGGFGRGVLAAFSEEIMALQTLAVSIQKTSNALNINTDALRKSSASTARKSESLSGLSSAFEKLKESIAITNIDLKNFFEYIKKIIEANTEAAKSADDFSDHMIGAIEAARPMQTTFASINRAGTDMFASIIDGSKSAKEALNDFLRSVLNAIIQIIAQVLVLIALGIILNILLPWIGVGGKGLEAARVGAGVGDLFGAEGGVVPTPSGGGPALPSDLSDNGTIVGGGTFTNSMAGLGAGMQMPAQSLKDTSATNASITMVTINAVDSKSFAEMLETNGDAITSVVSTNLANSPSQRRGFGSGGKI